MILAYEGRGTSGPALILLHGFPLDRGMWRGQLAGLGARARVVAPDLPGAGHSPAPATDVITIESQAATIIALANGLGFEHFMLAGLSMGGYVALDLVRRFPGRVAGLALLDTRADADSDETRAGRHADAERIVAEGAGFLIDKMLPKWLAPATLAGRPDVLNAVKAMAEGASRAALAATQRGMGARRDSRPDLAAIAVPTVVIRGRDDAIVPDAEMRALAAAIPGARFIEVPGGHFSPIEAPDEVNAALATLL